MVRTSFKELFWALGQMIAHQASNDAPLEAGDLVATGTVSGAAREARACLAEITKRGGASIVLPDGSERNMLEEATRRPCVGGPAEGFVTIGFRGCSGIIQPAKTA